MQAVHYGDEDPNNEAGYAGTTIHQGSCKFGCVHGIMCQHICISKEIIYKRNFNTLHIKFVREVV